MRRLSYMICVLIHFLMVSCQSELKDFEVAVIKIFPDIEEGSVDYIVVIPNQGCGGCITFAEEFYNDYKSVNNIKYIFTNVVSVKMLKTKIEINENNTFLDLNNDIVRVLPPDAKIYPSVIVVKNGEPINICYQSPSENGLSIIDETKLK